MSPHGGQDWTGFAVVMGMLALVLLATAPRTREWFRTNDDRLQSLIDQALDRPAPVEVDHETCVNDDCDLVLCYCRNTTAPCTGTVEPGCGHHDFLCDAHRLDCQGCREDARHDAGFAR